MIAIHTQRLTLKKPDVVEGSADKDRIVAQLRNWEVTKMLSSVPYPYTGQDAEAWFAMGESQEHVLSLNIFLDEQLIGGIGLTPADESRYELGYWLGESYWGQGFATEAAQGLLEFAAKTFNQTFVTTLDKSRVFAICYLENPGSANVLKKLGFREVSRTQIFSQSRDCDVDAVKVELSGWPQHFLK